MKPRWMLEAAGISLILSFPYFAALLYPGNLTLYHHTLDLGNLIGGILLAMFAVFLLALALIAYVHHRFPPRPRKILGALFAGLIFLHGMDAFLALLNQVHSSLNSTSGEAPNASLFAAFASLFWYSPLFRLLVIALLGIIAWRKPSWTQPFVRGVRMGVAALAFSLIWIVPGLTFLAFGHRPVKPFDNSASVHLSQPHQRIVWILFDELSQNLVFDDPPPGMQFPNLQKLRSHSVSFDDVVPLGFYTDRIIPSLLAGNLIVRMRSNTQGELSYFDGTMHRWVPYKISSTLFGKAQSAGWSSGVAGWFNPYCRWLASVVTACTWRPGLGDALPLEVLGASEDKSVLDNALVAIGVFLTEPTPSPQDLRGTRIRDFSYLMQQADHMIRDGNIDFVFVHLPVPHPPGFYNRNTHKFCTCGNYLDNLVLADDTMGKLMQEIDQTPWAGQTTVIVSSDHSWRVPLWSGSPGWTPEEEKISKGKFDTRSVFLVHFPGQTTSYQVAGPVPEMSEHNILSSMLSKQVTSPQSLFVSLHLAPPASHTP